LEPSIVDSKLKSSKGQKGKNSTFGSSSLLWPWPEDLTPCLFGKWKGAEPSLQTSVIPGDSRQLFQIFFDRKSGKCLGHNLLKQSRDLMFDLRLDAGDDSLTVLVDEIVGLSG